MNSNLNEEGQCKLLRVSHAEAARVLDDLAEHGRDLTDRPLGSPLDLARARAELAYWSASVQRRLADLFADPVTATVYRRAIGGTAPYSPFTGGSSLGDGARKFSQAVERRLSELSLVRSWIDQCH